MSKVKMFALLASVHAQLLAQPEVIKKAQEKLALAHNEVNEELAALVAFQAEHNRLVVLAQEEVVNCVNAMKVKESTEAWKEIAKQEILKNDTPVKDPLISELTEKIDLAHKKQKKIVPMPKKNRYTNGMRV